MLKAGITTRADQNEALKIQKRQQYEEERKKRIFNAKQRLFGLDLETLEKQISEKSKQRQLEDEHNNLYKNNEILQKKMVRAKAIEEEKRIRAIKSDLNYYRCRFQRKDQRREFDLNDPDYLKKARPVRIADNDIALGISSAQVFSGEDLHGKERKYRQREQQRAWLDQQIQEHKNAEAARTKADSIMMESISSRDKRLEDMAKSEHLLRNQIVDSIRNYNVDLARQKAADRERQKREKMEDDMAEIYNMLTSDMLTENPDVAQSRTNPNKKIAFMYRGMTPAELESFRKGQQQQLISIKKRETEQQLMNKQWEQYAMNMDRGLVLKQIELDMKRKEQLDDLIRCNSKLAVEQALQKQEARRQNTNYVSQDFYDQFNKTSR